MSEVLELAGDCPYAEGSKHIVIESATKTIVSTYIEFWDDTFDVVVFRPSIMWFGFYEYCMRLMPSLAKLDLTLIPNAKGRFILLQRLSHLLDASEHLMRTTNYYDRLSDDDFTMLEYRRGLL